jgi:cell division protein FtsZ
MDFGMFEVEDMVQDEQATSTIIKVVGVGGLAAMQSTV